MFKKDLTLKTIVYFITIIFLFNATAYGIELPINEKLRVPIGLSEQRIEEAKVVLTTQGTDNKFIIVNYKILSLLSSLSNLETQLKTEADPNVRLAINTALGNIYLELAKQNKDINLPNLETQLKTEADSDVRLAIAAAFGNIYLKLWRKNKITLSHLETQLKTEADPDVRLAIATALGNIYLELAKATLKLLTDLGIDNESLFLDYLEINSTAQNKNFEQLTAKYNELKDYFKSKNDTLEDSRRINYEEFFRLNEAKIALLFEIMGEGAFNFLKRFLNKDPYPLRRFFEALDTIGIDRNILDTIKEFYTHNPKKDLSSFQKILEITSLFIQNGKKIIFAQTLRESIKSNLDWKSISDKLSITALKDLATSLGITANNFSPEVLPRFPVTYIPRLKVAMDFIKNNHHDKLELFKALLKATFENRHYDFITNENQSDTIGIKLSKHNKSVREDIKNCGINLEEWLNYDKEKPFSFSDRNLKINPEDEAVKTMELTVALYEKLDRKYQIMLENILKKMGLEISKDSMDKLPLKAIDKNRNNMRDILSPLLAMHNIEKLSKSIDFIKSKLRDKISIQENILHLSQSIDTLKQQIVNPDVLKELAKKKMYFNIRMWKRDPAHDLFLGDFTGCCMAANSNDRFEAMIDHVIDQGIQVAEVIDEDTGKTMALAWLFLAKDTQNNPYLVIDNIEVNADYSALKGTIKNNLIDYCKEYTYSIGSKALLAGLFGDSKVDITEFPQGTFNLTKIGGYFGEEKYYLEALESNQMRVIERIEKRKKSIDRINVPIIKKSEELLRQAI